MKQVQEKTAEIYEVIEILKKKGFIVVQENGWFQVKSVGKGKKIIGGKVHNGISKEEIILKVASIALGSLKVP